jgi:hypothetical protein
VALGLKAFDADRSITWDIVGRVGAENRDLFELRECHFRAYKSLGSGPTPSNDPCNGYARIKIITKRHINNRSINSFVKLKTFWSPRSPSLIFRDLSIKNYLFIYLFRF